MSLRQGAALATLAGMDEIERGISLGYCTDDRTALDIRTVLADGSLLDPQVEWQPAMGDARMERFCPECGLVQ